MKIISFIEDEEVIEKILKHLGLWEMKARLPLKSSASLVTMHFDYSDFIR
jgi:energy-converting hydrogenase Eha subunit H